MTEKALQKKILLLSGHPSINSSRSNRLIINNLRNLIENIVINNIEEYNPSEVNKERKQLVEADAIIFQFPVFWYAVPANLKHWIDSVLSIDLVYDEMQNFKNKIAIISFTSGGNGLIPEMSLPESQAELTKEIAAPLKRTLKFFGIQVVDVLSIFGVSSMAEDQLSELCLLQAKRISKSLKSS